MTGKNAEAGVKMLAYGDWYIYPNDPPPPIPGWQKFAWAFVHKDYDGPGDNRSGYAESEQACRETIDEFMP